MIVSMVLFVVAVTHDRPKKVRSFHESWLN